MVGWRTLASCVALLVLSTSAPAQTYLLQEKDLAGSYFQVKLQMELKGKLIFQQQDKSTSLDQQASATQEFTERVLKNGEQGLIAKTARHYQTAKATISVDKKETTRTLSGDHALIVAQHGKDGLLSFCPKGALTRDELDLLEHFDTLALPGLLPSAKVAVGETWKLNSSAAQGLCYFDGLTSQDLAGKLEKVTGNKATFSIAGSANGIAGGAVVKLKIKAEGTFDLDAGRIVALTWQQDDERDQGPASPAMTAAVSVTMARQPIAAVNELSDIALVPVPQTPEPPASMTALRYADPQKRFHLNHNRAWLMVARTKEHVVLRLLDRGEFVAQVSITNWPKAEAGKHMDIDAFKAAMKDHPGWEQIEEKEAGEVPSENGNYIYRLATLGNLNDQKTMQYFYLVAGTGGDQMVLAFTLTPTQIQKLGSRDLELVRSLTFPAAKKADASKSAP